MIKKEKFTEKCFKKFNNNFDYSESTYIDSTKKIKIKCKKHDNFFYQTPAEHLRGKNGCNFCTRNPKIDTEFFINKSKEIHGDKYDYSKSVYIDSKTKIEIVCKEHGSFFMLPNNHYKQNCPSCFDEKRFSNNLNFINKSKEIHNKYEYTNINYINSKEKVNILCPIHGEFNQRPNDHLNGKGCPKCGFIFNKSEDELKDFIKNVNIDFIENSREIITPLELDIFIPSHNIAIEYNGLYWHSELHKTNDYHLTKTKECENKGIQLIHIFEDEWLYKKDIVKSRILNLLGLNKDKIYGRKTEIREVLSKESNLFLTENHIQGNVNSKIKLGLFYNNELVSLMTFGDLRKNMGGVVNKGDYELLRFCNKLNTTVIGGADKLLKHFIKHYQVKKLISYADRRWSKGNLYEKLGFEFIHDSKPSYFYIINYKRENRFKYRKDVLIKEGYDTNKTEHQIMLDRKIYRIYDCGSKKYVLNFS